MPDINITTDEIDPVLDGKISDIEPTKGQDEKSLEEVLQLCGRCKREKVNGKCPACGRPNEFKEEYIQEAYKYIEEHQDTPRGESEDKLDVKLPTLEGFARRLGKKLDTLKDWAKENEKFSVAFENIREEQRQRLLNKGLSGQYNPVIAKLILSANHGMAEKTQQDITSKGEKVDGLAVSFVKPKDL